MEEKAICNIDWFDNIKKEIIPDVLFKEDEFYEKGIKITDDIGIIAKKIDITDREFHIYADESFEMIHNCTHKSTKHNFCYREQLDFEDSCECTKKYEFAREALKMLKEFKKKLKIEYNKLIKSKQDFKFKWFNYDTREVIADIFFKETIEEAEKTYAEKEFERKILLQYNNGLLDNCSRIAFRGERAKFLTGNEKRNKILSQSKELYVLEEKLKDIKNVIYVYHRSYFVSYECCSSRRDKIRNTNIRKFDESNYEFCMEDCDHFSDHKNGRWCGCMKNLASKDSNVCEHVEKLNLGELCSCGEKKYERDRCDAGGDEMEIWKSIKDKCDCYESAEQYNRVINPLIALKKKLKSELKILKENKNK